MPMINPPFNRCNPIIDPVRADALQRKHKFTYPYPFPLISREIRAEIRINAECVMILDLPMISD